tara:strand:- start:730 stop:1200 length:471 start_codon:yes stop_codon:yes gene_type:complete
MNSTEKLNLDRLLEEYKPEETSKLIQKLKHSQLILKDVVRMEIFHKKFSRLKGTKTYQRRAEKTCSFIYKNYNNIFQRLLKQQLDYSILKKFLFVLKQIEDGKVDQHEGSRQVGVLLKNLFIDSVLKQKKSEKSPKKPKYNISWSDWSKKETDLNI